MLLTEVGETTQVQSNSFRKTTFMLLNYARILPLYIREEINKKPALNYGT